MDDNDDRMEGGSSASEDEQDELMEDIDDGEGELEADVDGDMEEDNDDNEGEDNDNDDDRSDSNQHQSGADDGEGNYLSTKPSVVRTSASPRQTSAPLPSPRFRIRPPEDALTATSYDILPTIAAPQSTSINALTATPDMRYVYTGGADGYVREFNWTDTVKGKTLLTVAQRHPFVDSVTKAGVLMSYWENEEPNPKTPGDEPALSPVYSLAVHHQALWLLSGLESGSINLQSVRHEKGKRITTLKQHNSAVSVLNLSRDETSVLSGSWDKNIHDWDLNTGQVRRSFEGSGGQISSIEIRPASSLPVPEGAGELENSSGTFSSNNADKPLGNGLFPNGINGVNVNEAEGDDNDDAPGSPADSLFGGGGDSLFGDNDTNIGAPSGGGFGGDDDDEFTKALELGLENPDAANDSTDLAMADADADADHSANALGSAMPDDSAPETIAEVPAGSPSNVTNGLPHSEEIIEHKSSPKETPDTQDAVATADSTFLSSSMDGTIRIWDRRQQAPVAYIPTRTGVPPWCMSACWSPDGNYIFAGRRNCTVEEYSLHKGFKAPERVFKFPQGSNAVTALRPMPNGRHLMCASQDILRLYDLKSPQTRHSTVPFLIIPGTPKGGVTSAIHVDPSCKWLITTGGNRGWEGSCSEVLLAYEIGWQK